MRGAIVSKPESREIALDVLEFLRNNDFNVELVEDFSTLSDYEFIVIVGGDGTILRVLQNLDQCPPIFGINTGRIGLLTHCEVGEYKEQLLKALKSFEFEEFMRLECRIGDKKLLALNEIAILCSTPAKLVEMEIYVNGTQIEKIRCDGLLVATSIGSTAYALSTGGPIVDPYLSSILIVPVAPFKLGWKPWVLKDDRVVEVSFDRGVFVVADGQSVVEVDSGSITVRKSNSPAKFFKIENRIEKIVKKLRSIC